jgi:DNA invertase Pin-like site-specific DNA recombinase
MADSKIRCAIYTRKSSDEGLEQEFNSLDAQYEACSAYIASQKHEGWKRVNKRYDDGGISGGTLKRAGLAALLNDIDAGLIDMIVVYKIDRLTRSLSDFSRIVDRLEASKASFVSVTQSFNTASSMGRLTLNMLLSFAQFEREVTAERIRDKIAASKAKGLWMGGTVPLGYDPNPDKTVRGLVANQIEATEVQSIFELYDQLGNMRLVRDKIEEIGLRSKLRNYASGKRMGGSIMSKGQIHHILRNPIYIGKIRHKEKVYDGHHEAIIQEDVWARVQAKLQAASSRQVGQCKDPHHSQPLLLGKVLDDTDDHLTPTHTKKNGRILRYYISNRLIKQKDPNGWRLPAKKLEDAIEKAVREHLQALQKNMALFVETDLAKLLTLYERIDTDGHSPAGTLSALKQAKLGTGELYIQLSKRELAKLLNINESQIAPKCLNFTTPFAVKRRSNETKIILGDLKPSPDKNLLNALKDARFWLNELRAGKSLAQIAKDSETGLDFIRKRIRLGLLSPTIQKAILSGDHPDNWSVSLFTRSIMPTEWKEQEDLFAAKSN